mmetsp:Transcript_13775/g.19132  ORF Transcript_13775/g.19132 Transcript_13775/m.19132 type:complete len:603 (-) Transcript_13775:561-2369(-)|eukprot:CAMPEP_0184481688 /NCGR_PEP_ID=MMETSP0113_2-20130426/3249_1 /TAXON_ID=91329 /ORGANISM="Norrisiella sphaerica, Strain BC52" /LENGTH=602 /DNA_ID=CAMNT_0026860969 /DNA_START=250 /DNA_END=2058 /DNA_ORIENTATION=+
MSSSVSPPPLTTAAAVVTIFLLPSFPFRAAFILAVGFIAMWVCRLPAPLPPLRRKRKRGIANDRYKRTKIPEGVDVIIIGSGMGGLSCGATLSRMGKKVLVLEQHTVAGGSTHSFDLKGYRFDSGLHYSVPWSGPLFQLSCLRKPEHVPQFTKMGREDDSFDQIYLGSNQNPFLIKHNEKHLSDLYRMFPEEKAAIDEYIRVSDIVLVSVRLFAFSKLLPLWLQPYFWSLVPGDYKKYPLMTGVEIFERLTKNRHLISILCGLWIDTGARPDIATFMLTAAVFRGMPLEGACYPTDGPECMAEAYIEVITAAGGAVLTRAEVAKVLVTDNKAIGVELANGDKIHAETVISGTGFANTMECLIDKETREKNKLPTKLSQVEMSSGFVMANIGIRASAEELKLDNVNVWYHPAEPETKDIIPPLKRYYENPLENDAPAMITFPSIKAGNRKSPKTSCQMLLMGEWKWFEKFSHLTEKERENNKEYQAVKAKWKQKCLDLLFKFYPQVEDKIELIDISTPLSIHHYLRTPKGGAVGLDQTPKRYFSWEVQRHLDISTPIKNLYMTGQDQLICGVVLAQLCGVITAFRVGGILSSIRVVLQSVYLI